jgi:hypothetical protein
MLKALTKVDLRSETKMVKTAFSNLKQDIKISVAFKRYIEVTER